MEIERKFLLNTLPDLENAQKYEICQWYISYEPEIRVRKTLDRYVITEKSSGTLVREECEHEIDEASALLLIASCGRKPVEKTRYRLPFGELCAEIDIYKGELSGLAVCEFEFESVADAERALLPDWVGEELTGKGEYRNAALSKKINEEK